MLLVHPLMVIALGRLVFGLRIRAAQNEVPVYGSGLARPLLPGPLPFLPPARRPTGDESGERVSASGSLGVGRSRRRHSGGSGAEMASTASHSKKYSGSPPPSSIPRMLHISRTRSGVMMSKPDADFDGSTLGELGGSPAVAGGETKVALRWAAVPFSEVHVVCAAEEEGSKAR